LIRLDAKGAPQISGVPDLIQGLLVNVIDNAIKYSYANQKVPIRVLREGDEVEISITNFGTGININDLPHIFTPFYRAKHRDITHPIRGVGLGLPTCKRIVDVHQGTIFATSEKWYFDDPVRVERMEGYKTTFTIRLPTNLRKGRRDVDSASLTKEEVNE
jgi:signal transduction histidine kinase